MSRALVAIGVSRPGRLEPLPGAARDAAKVGDWAKKAGYNYVRVLTDATKGATVTAEKVYNICEKLLKIKGLDRLVIFFSGHGISPLPGHEFWLLSGWHK